MKKQHQLVLQILVGNCSVLLRRPQVGLEARGVATEETLADGDALVFGAAQQLRKDSGKGLAVLARDLFLKEATLRELTNAQQARQRKHLGCLQIEGAQ